MTQTKGNRFSSLLAIAAVLILSGIARAEGQRAAEESLAKAQNDYFNAVFSGKARTPDELSELRQKLIDPHVNTLSRMVITQPKEMLIAPGAGELNPGLKAKKANPYAKESPGPEAAATPEPEVVVEGTEQKYMLEFKKGLKEKVAAQPEAPVAAEMNSKAQGVDLLELPGPAKASPKPGAKKR